MLAGVFAAALDAAPRVNLGADRTITSTVADPGAADATYSLESNGDYLENGADAGDWIAPKAAAGAAYEARATIVSGTLSSGTTGSWAALSSPQGWTRNRAGVGTTTCVIDVEVRLAATGTVLDTVRITLRAVVTPP